MTTSLCSSSSNDTRSLADLLQEAVVYVQDDEFHPILYQALAGLHQYIGSHQERMMMMMMAAATTASASTGQQPNDKENHHHRKIKPPTTKTSMHGQDMDAQAITQEHDMTADQSIEVAMDENDADLVHVLDDPDDQGDDSIAVKDSSEANSPQKDEFLVEKEEMEDTVVRVGEEKSTSERPDHSMPSQPQTLTKSPRKQEAEEKRQEIEVNLKDKQEDQAMNEALKHQKLSNQRPKQQPIMQPPEPQLQQPKKSSATAVSPNSSHTPAELIVEQQKKLAAERRRQDVELQRKLARVEQKQKDLQAKRTFLEKEQRKQELVAQSQQPGSVASSNAKESLRQIAKQMAAVDADMKQQRIEVTRIKTQIEKRKEQQQEHAANSLLHHHEGTEDLIMMQQKRLVEQARREKTLESQKMAAAEKRRQELEEQRRKAREEQKKKDQIKKRRFLEQEQRKQDLISQARAGGRTTAEKDSALLQKLSSQVSELDAEVERKRSEETKNEPGDDEEHEEPEDVSQEELRQGSLNRTRIQSPPSSGDGGLRSANEHMPLNYGKSKPQTQSSFAPSEQTRVHKKQSTQYSSQSASSHHQQHQCTPDQSNQQPSLHQPYQHLPKQPPQSSPLRQQHKRPNQEDTRHKHAPFGSSDQVSTSASHDRSNPHQPGNPAPQDSSPASQGKHDTSDPSSQPHHPPTGSDQKYTKMAEQNDNGEESSSMADLKRNILVHWALQPPYMQCLRPIDELLRTIHQVYPPAHDLPPHSYFDGWQKISNTDLLNPTTAALDEKSLSKAVRKLRFFLHPDKLPADLTAEHQFTCKLLWDVTNDAWEDHKRAKEELDWMHN